MPGVSSAIWLKRLLLYDGNKPLDSVRFDIHPPHRDIRDLAKGVALACHREVEAVGRQRGGHVPCWKIFQPLEEDAATLDGADPLDAPGENSVAVIAPGEQ